MQPKATSAGPPTGIVHCFHLWALILKTIAQAQLAAQNTQSWLQLVAYKAAGMRGADHISTGRGEGENPRGGAKKRVNRLIQKFD